MVARAEVPSRSSNGVLLTLLSASPANKHANTCACCSVRHVGQRSGRTTSEKLTANVLPVLGLRVELRGASLDRIMAWNTLFSFLQNRIT